MRKASLQQQAVELIEQLSTEKLKTVIDYLSYLQDKEAWEATHELASNPEIVKSFRTFRNGCAGRKAKALERCQTGRLMYNLLMRQRRITTRLMPT